MIISHKHKYIFVKTSKVAGTSTEMFFEQMSFSKGQPQHGHSEIINEDGIVGHRGDLKKQEKRPTWLSHCKLTEIKKILNNVKGLGYDHTNLNALKSLGNQCAGGHHVSHMIRIHEGTYSINTNESKNADDIDLSPISKFIKNINKQK